MADTADRIRLALATGDGAAGNAWNWPSLPRKRQDSALLLPNPGCRPPSSSRSPCRRPTSAGGARAALTAGEREG